MLIKMHASALTIITALLAYGGPASAIGLMQAYESALQYDPTYRSAFHENTAGQQNKILGRSYLLPNVSATYSSFKNKGDVVEPERDLIGRPTGRDRTRQLDYRSNASGLTLRQPLLNLDGFARYNQGIAQTNYSDALFTARGQDLVLRLSR